jgi:hypothetical protein
MNLHARLLGLLAAARRRQAFAQALLYLPWLFALAVLGLRTTPGLVASLASLVAVVFVGLSWRSLARFDQQWLQRRLDEERRELEDSSELLFADEAALAPLARLQKSRLQQRLQATPLPDLRPAWPWRGWRWSWLGAALLALVILYLPMPGSDMARSTTDGKTAPAIIGETRLVAARLDTAPPAYTGLPARREEGLQARVPEGSRLRWTLRFDADPQTVALRFHDGQRLPLRREGEDWIGERVISRATLYRIELEGAPPLADAALQRVEVIADRPPQIRVLAPERTLNLLEAGQAQWALEFEASDDHGLANAQLRITLAQGSGETITVRARTMDLPGTGDRRQRRYRTTLDLKAQGFAEGDDLIVRLTVSDNRAPRPQATRSPSFILRWPPPTGAEGSGLEGMLKKVLPTYFRSQRQIIIDTEALLKERRRLPRSEFEQRSFMIGSDQRLLRLRYGQFMGEEVEEGPGLPDGHTEDDGHDHGGGEGSAMGGNEAPTVLEAFGHTHDIPEAATLLDPETRALLRKALDQMWRAEEQLRLGLPDKALPYEYRALGFIKQVQQASRIYLARVGLELPSVDEARRLTGKREGLAPRGDALVARSEAASPAADLWRALEAGATPAQLTAFEAWLREHEAGLPQALSLHAALDEVRRDPGCRGCALRLRAQLWPLLPLPATAVPARAGDDRAARAYLDALQKERRP